MKYVMKNMNKQKNPYNELENAIENFLTGELTATPIISKKIQISNMNGMGETACSSENINFVVSIRGGN